MIYFVRCVKKQNVLISVNAGVEGNMKQQQQLSWYVQCADNCLDGRALNIIWSVLRVGASEK